MFSIIFKSKHLYDPKYFKPLIQITRLSIYLSLIYIYIYIIFKSKEDEEEEAEEEEDEGRRR